MAYSPNATNTLTDEPKTQQNRESPLAIDNNSNNNATATRIMINGYGSTTATQQMGGGGGALISNPSSSQSPFPSSTLSDHFNQHGQNHHFSKPLRNYRRATIFCTLLSIILLASTVGMAVVYWMREQEVASVLNETGPDWAWPKASGSMYAHYRRAAVATDNGFCSEVGRDVLLEGGNAVDATIASLACVGVLNPQSSGLGGGFFMTLYNASTGQCLTINAREAAPLSANSTMFADHPMDAIRGYQSIATPGEVHGFWTAFRHYGSGRVSWKRLLEPSVRLARYGFPITSNLAMHIRNFEQAIRNNSDMKSTFVNAETGKLFSEGEIMLRPALADFLEDLGNATDPVQFFYHGRVAGEMVAEMQANGGIITREDLSIYRAKIDQAPAQGEMFPGSGLVLCGHRPPSGSAIVNAIVSILARFYNGTASVDLNDPVVYHRLIEAEKFGYAARAQLGDIALVHQADKLARNLTSPEFAQWAASMIQDHAQPREYYTPHLNAAKQDHGTSHVSVIDPAGNAVSATSSVNQYFGAQRISTKFGFVWNDEMDDFSTPGQINGFGLGPSPENFIEPQKRPMSSMSPMVIYNRANGRVKMAVGASGGSRIISAIAQTIIRTLLFNQTVKEAVDAPRIHNQFTPLSTEYERTVPQGVIHSLVEQHGQNMTAIEKQASVVQALIVMDDGFIHGNSDYRRKTATFPAGF